MMKIPLWNVNKNAKSSFVPSQSYKNGSGSDSSDTVIEMAT